MDEDMPEDAELDARVAVDREREVATQKARIVSQMTPRSKLAASRASPTRRPTLAPAKTMPTLATTTTTERDAKPVLAGSTNGKSGQKISLFDLIAYTLENAMSSDRTFRSPRELSGASHEPS